MQFGLPYALPHAVAARSAASERRRTAMRRQFRKAEAVVLAGVVCAALAVCAGRTAGQGGGVVSAVMFVLTLPWLLAAFLTTMLIDVTGRVEVWISLAITTLVMWWIVSSVLIRWCVNAPDADE